MVVLTDSNGQTLCFMSDFTVSGSASSTATYWTVQDPSGTKLGQLVQETEEAVAEAVESEAEAVTRDEEGNVELASGLSFPKIKKTQGGRQC